MKRATVGEYIGWTLLAILVVSVSILLAAPPQVVIDDPNAAPANHTALLGATGEVPLPVGVVSVSPSLNWTRANASLTMFGPTTVKNPNYVGDWFTDSAAVIRPGAKGTDALSWRGDPRPAVLPAGQIGWSFVGGDNSLSAPKPIRIFPGQTVPQTNEFIRAFNGVPWNYPYVGMVVYNVGPNHGIAVGEDIFATDGPMINECVGEFRRVVAVTPQTITLDQPLRRSYTQGTFVRGPFPRSMAFNGVKFEGVLGAAVLNQCIDMQFADCTFANQYAPISQLAVIGCGRMDFRRCTVPLVGISSGTGIRFSDCVIGDLRAEQSQVDGVVERCRMKSLDTTSRCERWTITDCEFSEWFGIYDDWVVTNCRAGRVVYVRGRNAVVRNLRAVGPVVVQSGLQYPGAGIGSGRGILMDGIDCAYVDIWPGTSGHIKNCSAVVTFRDPTTKASWLRDGKPIP